MGEYFSDTDVKMSYMVITLITTVTVSVYIKASYVLVISSARDHVKFFSVTCEKSVLSVLK